MQTKKCNKCGKEKSITCFHTANKHKDGLYNTCRACSSIIAKERGKTKDGLSLSMYNSQRNASRKRNYQMPDYSLIELRAWLYAQSNFNEMYKRWVDSGYNKWLKPSCDRINDYKPYTFKNIRLATWYENFLSYQINKMSGINNKVNISVIRLCKITGDITIYHSMSQAGRENNLKPSTISRYCSGIRGKRSKCLWMKST